jgi:hypothetical protein
LCLIFELMEMNVFELIQERRNHLPEDKIKSLVYQLVKGGAPLHEFSMASDGMSKFVDD